MNIGNPSNFSGPTYSVFYGDGVTATFTLQVPSIGVGPELVFVSGIQNVDYTINWSNNTLTFATAPSLGAKIVVIFIYSNSYQYTEVANGAVSASRLVDNSIAKYASLDLSANDKVVYSVNTTDLGTFSINNLSKQILAATSHSDLGTAVDILVNSGNQTISGTKTFTNRLGNNVRTPITFISQFQRNGFTILKNGEVYTAVGNTSSWASHASGRGASGSVGLQGVENFSKVFIPSTSSAVKIVSAGPDDIAVLMADGTLYGWGFNSSGCLGLGHTNPVPLPTLLASNVVDVYGICAGGSYVTSGLYNGRLFIKSTDGYIYATGHNGNGQLGLGDTTGRTSFTKVTLLGTNVTKIFSLGAEGAAIVAQKSDDTIWVFGYNGAGGLGLGNVTSNIATPTDATTAWQGGAGWDLEHVVGGNSYYNGSAAVWVNFVGILLRNRTTQATKILTSGNNGWGQCGDGTTTSRSTPYLIPNSGSVKQFAAAPGVSHCHMLNTDGTMYGWGYNNFGQVGTGTTSQAVMSPVLVQSGVDKIFTNGITHYANSYYHTTIIRKTDNQLYGAGYNGAALLGNGTAVDSLVFTRCYVPNNDTIVMMGFTDVNNNQSVILALGSSGKLYTWGNNSWNMITPGTTISCYTPTNVSIKDEL